MKYALALVFIALLTLPAAAELRTFKIASYGPDKSAVCTYESTNMKVKSITVTNNTTTNFCFEFRRGGQMVRTVQPNTGTQIISVAQNGANSITLLSDSRGRPDGWLGGSRDNCP